MSDTPAVWGLVACPDHHDLGAVHTGGRLEVIAWRAGCTSCLITVTCPDCGHTSRHRLVALAQQAEAMHLASCPGSAARGVL